MNELVMPWDLTSNSLMILLEGNTCVEKNLQELHVLLLLTNKIRMTFFQKPTEVLHIFYENNFSLGKYLLLV